MEIGDWITLAAVLVALGLGVTSLLQTQRLQRRERRERLLNEIVKWAIDVAECGIESDTHELLNDKDAAKSWPFLEHQSKKLDTLQLLMAKRVYMEQIAQELLKVSKNQWRKWVRI